MSVCWFNNGFNVSLASSVFSCVSHVFALEAICRRSLAFKSVPVIPLATQGNKPGLNNKRRRR